MAYVLVDTFGPQIEDANGDPLVNGSIEAYISGTSTPLAMHTDSSGTSLGTSCTLNSRGYPQTSGGTETSIFVNTQYVYKFVVKDSAGSTLKTIDPYYPLGLNSHQMADSFADAYASAYTGIEIVETRSFYDYTPGSDIPKGGAKYYRDGTTGTASTAYSDNSGFYDANGDGFKLMFNGRINVLSLGAYQDGTNAAITATAINNACTLLLGATFSRGGVVELPGKENDEGIYLVDGTINVPQSVVLEGSGLFTTRIRADSGFSDPYVVNLGDGRDGVSTGVAMFGCQLRHMTVDCQNQAIVGVYSQWINENSGLHDVSVIRSTTKNIHFYGGSGLTGAAQNYFLEKINCVLSASSTSGSIGIHIEGGNGVFKGMNDVTINRESAATLGTGIKLEDITGGLVSDIHGEAVTNVIDVETSNGFAISGVRSFTTATTVVNIDASSNAFTLSGITTGGATNALVHAPGDTVTLPYLGFYSWGSGNGSNNTKITTNDNDVSRFRNASVTQFFDIPFASELTIAAGAITVTASAHPVDTEADAASDDLDTITGGNNGTILILKPVDTARTIVIKHGTGNIFCGTDFTMDNSADRIVLQKFGSSWVQLFRSDNGA